MHETSYIKVEHAARGPKAQSKARRFGPVQARHGLDHNRARAGPKHVVGCAWANPRLAERHGPTRF